MKWKWRTDSEDKVKCKCSESGVKVKWTELKVFRNEVKWSDNKVIVKKKWCENEVTSLEV